MNPYAIITNMTSAGNFRAPSSL